MDINLIKGAIIKAIPDAQIFVANPEEDGQHFQALVVSATFETLSLIKQHQSVMKSLKEQFDSEALHALALKTFTPAKWDVSKASYNLG
ncbi:BolA/IbaG family iron-sulfur metabolism protein [bacterium]|jgi:acid stress-induced BolA-like protein IbaG/YrbA|nr:BolA/IbaG family iron-sulfur metabolism protein [bacterium]